jgi:hypothetical protein
MRWLLVVKFSQISKWWFSSLISSWAVALMPIVILTRFLWTRLETEGGCEC